MQRDASEGSRSIPYARQTIDEADIAAVVEVLRSDFLTQGPQIELFEAALCEATGARFAVAVSSGTAALHLACLGLGIGKGDTGVVPAITFAATANCLRYCGAEVAFCDVDPETGCATEAAFRAAEAAPKVLLPVSFAGRVSELESIHAYARSVEAFVIEDAAHSLGARYTGSDGREYRSGSCRHSDAAILSFHPVKHVCAGEGGAVLTNDAEVASRMRRLRSHGIEKTDAVAESDGLWAYDQLELGMHYRMTELQAALGRSQLGRLETFIEERLRISGEYNERFGLAPFESVFERPGKEKGLAWHLYVVRFKDAEARRRAYDFLHANGIRAQVHYRPVYRNSYYESDGFSLEGAEAFYATCLSLPLYPGLKEAEQVRVVEVLRLFCESELGG